jgi:hypothetical protein
LVLLPKQESETGPFSAKSSISEKPPKIALSNKEVDSECAGYWNYSPFFALPAPAKKFSRIRSCAERVFFVYNGEV